MCVLMRSSVFTHVALSLFVHACHGRHGQAIKERKSSHHSPFIYVYSTHDAPLLQNVFERCNASSWGDNQYSTELYFHKWLASSPYSTADKERASLFYVPVYTKCLKSMIGADDTAALVRGVLESLLPFQLNGGEDHIFLFPSGAGPTFVPDWRALFKNSIFLMTEPHFTVEAAHHAPYFTPHKDILIPGYVGSLAKVQPWIETTATFHDRPTLALYIASDQDLPLRQRVRSFALRHSTKIASPHLEGPDYVRELTRAKFCLVPRGLSSWTLRLFESILAGCVPVLINDHIRFPFEDALDYRRFTVKWPENAVDESLVRYLESVDESTWSDAFDATRRSMCHFVYFDAPGLHSCVYDGVMRQLRTRVKLHKSSPLVHWRLGSPLLDATHKPMIALRGPFDVEGVFDGLPH